MRKHIIVNKPFFSGNPEEKTNRLPTGITYESIISSIIQHNTVESEGFPYPSTALD